MVEQVRLAPLVVSETIEKLKVTVVSSLTPEEEPVAGGVREPLLSQTKHLRPKQSRLSPLHQSRVRVRRQTLLTYQNLRTENRQQPRRHSSTTTSGHRILRRRSSVLSAPFAALSQTTFKSLTRTMRKTLPLQLHLVLGHCVLRVRA